MVRGTVTALGSRSSSGDSEDAEAVVVGEFCCFPSETIPTARRCIWSRPTATSPSRNGTPASSLPWSCGIRTIPPSIPSCVGRSPLHYLWGQITDDVLTAATHRFTAEEGDWGFTRFAEMRKLFAPRWEQRDHPMIEKQTVNVTAYVRVVKDPTGVLWHNFIK